MPMKLGSRLRRNGVLDSVIEGMRLHFGDHPHLMLLLPITSNTDKRRVALRICRIGFPILKSCKAQPADLADTYSRTSVPRPVLSIWVKSVKSSRIRLELGISWLTSR